MQNVLREACGGRASARCEAKHRSDSAARSTPTRSAARDTPRKINMLLSLIQNSIWFITENQNFIHKKLNLYIKIDAYKQFDL
ncbi:MAG: hypothetical protein NZ455_03100 [Bacteroidia bacterium]|nr:hypothetical protein [Bacteroidia bacterium]